MTPLETAIAQAVARTRIERELPGAILAAMEAEGYVVIDAGRWRRVHEFAAAMVGVREMSNCILDPEPCNLAATRARRATDAMEPGDLDPSAEKMT